MTRKKQNEGIIEEGKEVSSKNMGLIRTLIDQAENNLRSIKNMLFEETLKEKAKTLPELGYEPTGKEQIVEGVFDGENMIGKDDKKYPVPPNYASKSKLVVGDVLKLTIASDGTFIFKQIGPVERKKLIGVLHREDSRYFVESEGKNYDVLLASVTYFKAQQNDQVTIVVPREGESQWAALENVIKKA